MQVEIKTEGMDFVVSWAPQPKNDNDGQRKADRKTGTPRPMKAAHVTDEHAARIADHAARLRTRAAIADEMQDGEGAA